jgi:hypothetical protein
MSCVAIVGVPIEPDDVERHYSILWLVSFAIKQRAEALQRLHDTWSD